MIPKTAFASSRAALSEASSLKSFFIVDPSSDESSLARGFDAFLVTALTGKRSEECLSRYAATELPSTGQLITIKL